ncbi:MAG: hypothetical protein NE328_15210 [Lentisphaeraceae bacterium]|nr:hypothetical protein [Lentisphaeraceae bacterium]
MRDKQLFSPKQIGIALGVSEASIKRWVDKGIIECIKTDGGHRKIPMYALINYIHKNDADLVNPEAVNIPKTSGRLKDKMSKSAEDLQQGFHECDEFKIQGIIYDLFTSGQEPEKIFDELLAPALHQLGCDWEDGHVDAFQERRTVQICIRALYGFHSFFPLPEKNAPIAMIGTLSNDQYTIPPLMIEVCLRSREWKTEFLGNDLPASSYAKAIEMYKPDLMIISMSNCDKPEKAAKDLLELEAFAIKNNCGFILGGRAVPEKAVKNLKKTLLVPTISDMLKDMEAYRKSLKLI